MRACACVPPSVALCVCLSSTVLHVSIYPSLCMSTRLWCTGFLLSASPFTQALIFSCAHFCTPLEQIGYTSQASMAAEGQSCTVEQHKCCSGLPSYKGMIITVAKTADPNYYYGYFKVKTSRSVPDCVFRHNP